MPVPTPSLSTRETLRWFWRQLTSMRTALLLLLLLALAAVPGSLIPQRGVDSQAYAAFRLRSPELSVWLDRLGLFSVYTAPWFAGVYLLLLVALVGCIVPRARVYARALRARPSRAPRNFERLPAWRTVSLPLGAPGGPGSGATVCSAASGSSQVEPACDDRVDVAETDDGAAGRSEVDSVTGAAEEPVSVRASVDIPALLDVLQQGLRRRGTRVDRVGDELRAQSGYARELGNLLFHLSLVVVMVGVAAGGLFGYRGFVIVTEGSGFSNTRTQYDEFTTGALFEPTDAPPFSIRLRQVLARFQVDGPQRGAPRMFEASGSVVPAPGEPESAFRVRVNEPLTVGNTSMFLVGQGYAPIVRVRDGRGRIVFDQAVPFLPRDASYTSSGVVKVPEAEPDQLGFQGFFLPTAVRFGAQAPVSAFPAAANPNLGLFVFAGDLGLDEGLPQSVYTLDRSRLTRLSGDDGRPLRLSLSPGQVAVLPQGRGTVEFAGLAQFARFRVTSQPGMLVPLWAASIGLAGLMLSLYVRPRRTWVRVRRDDDRVVVEVAAIEPRTDPALQDHVDELAETARRYLTRSGGPAPSSTPAPSSSSPGSR